MPRDLTTATADAAAERNTQPGYFFELVLPSQTLRLSTQGDQTWNSLDWGGVSMKITGLGSLAPNVGIFDADAAFRTALLLDGAANCAARVWHYFVDALGDDDPVLLFSGFSGAFTWNRGRVTISLRRQGRGTSLSPRKRMTVETGFNYLAPSGWELRWGDRIITLG